MTYLLIIGFTLMVFGLTLAISGRRDKAMVTVGIFMLIVYLLDRYLAPFYGVFRFPGA